MLTWDAFFRENKELHTAIAIAVATKRILNGEKQYPPDEKIYEAFKYCELKDIKVIILGQDPYHGENEANGLAFSVNKGIKLPPSLKNIYKEIEKDLNIKIPDHGDLTKWAKQGVLLMNSCLTVAKDNPGSHFDVGWELFTDKVIEQLAKNENKVFMLWGKKAQEKEKLINPNKNLILKAPHPSPFSVNTGFFGSKHFSKCNDYLISKNLSPIDWNINE